MIRLPSRQAERNRRCCRRAEAAAPGVIPFGEHDERIERLICKTPAERAGTAEEIADAVIYFLTATNFVTGQVLAVNGGLSQK